MTGCPPATIPRHRDLGRSAPWRQLPATTWREPTAAGISNSACRSRMLLSRCSRPPPARDGGRSPSAPPCRDACRDRAVHQSFWRACVDALRIRQIDRADGYHLGRRARLPRGTMIMVATRRNEANESPSIISSSVIDLVGSGREQAIDASDLERMFEGDDFRRERIVMTAFRKRRLAAAPAEACACVFDRISHPFLRHDAIWNQRRTFGKGSTGFSARYRRSEGLRVCRSPRFPRLPSVTESHVRSRRKDRSASLSRFRLTDWIVPPVIVPLFLLLLVAAAALCMDSATQLQFLVSGNDQSARVNLGRPTAATP